MMKNVLIVLAVIMLVPNFIDKDINEQLPFDHKERFFPNLDSVNTIDKLETYVDQTAARKEMNKDSRHYVALLAYVISCRFYHGFSHWKLNENWIAAVGQKITGIGLACKVQPGDIMKHPYAACSQQALVMMEILRRKKIDYRKVGFHHHYALEVKIEGKWYFFDPNMEPRISFAQRSHENWMGKNDILKQYYNPGHHTNLDYQFGHGETAELGEVNEIPAQRAAFFQGFTSIVSKCLWCIPLMLAFVKRRRPVLYAVKPVNKNAVPSRRLQPLYYA